MYGDQITRPILQLLNKQNYRRICKQMHRANIGVRRLFFRLLSLAFYVLNKDSHSFCKDFYSSKISVLNHSFSIWHLSLNCIVPHFSFFKYSDSADNSLEENVFYNYTIKYFSPIINFLLKMCLSLFKH